MNLFRFQFVSIGDFGFEIMNRLKKRIITFSIDGIPLFQNTSENLLKNPYVFFSVLKKDKFDNLTDNSSFIKDNEIFSSEETNLNDLLKNKITNLSRLISSDIPNIDIVQNYPPIVIYVFDKKTYEDETYKKIINELLEVQFQANLLNNRNLILFIERTKENEPIFSNLRCYFNNIFLEGTDSLFPTIKEEDNIEIAVNFLSSIIQIQDSEIIKNYFNTATKGSISVFGTADIKFNKEELILESCNSLLWQQPPNDRLNDNLYKLLYGKYEKIESSSKNPFSLGEFEREDDIEKYTEEIYPQIDTITAEIASKIKDETVNWINSHYDRMNNIFDIETSFKKAEELYRADNFWDICLEDWADNLDAIDFMSRYNLIDRATTIAQKTRQDFEKKWEDDYFETLFSQLKANTNNGDIICNNGFLIFEYTKQIISFLKEKLRNIENRNSQFISNDTLYIEEKIGRKELDDYKNSIPHITSVITKIAMLLILFVALGPEAVKLLSPLVPITYSMIIGSILFVILSSSILYLSYYKKIKILKKKLRLFLAGGLNNKKKEINSIRKKLLKNFLLGILYSLKDKFVPRPNFFYYTVKQNIIDFNDLKKKDVNVFKNSLNLLERYFINLFKFLSELKRYDPFQSSDSRLSFTQFIPQKGDEEFKEIVSSIKKNYDFKILCENEYYHKNITNDLCQTDMDIMQAIKQMKQFFKETIENNFKSNYNNLTSFFEKYTDYEVNETIVESLIGNLKPTFWIDGVNMRFNINNYLIFSPLNFSPKFIINSKKSPIQSLDKDRIVFVYVLSEPNSKKIIWN